MQLPSPVLVTLRGGSRGKRICVVFNTNLEISCDKSERSARGK